MVRNIDVTPIAGPKQVFEGNVRCNVTLQGFLAHNMNYNLFILHYINCIVIDLCLQEINRVIVGNGLPRVLFNQSLVLRIESCDFSFLKIV